MKEIHLLYKRETGIDPEKTMDFDFDINELIGTLENMKQTVEDLPTEEYIAWLEETIITQNEKLNIIKKEIQ